MRYLLDVQEGSCDKTQQGLTYLTGNVRIASSYSPATSDKALPGAMAGSGGAAGTAGAGQSQPTEGHGDQPQHQGRGATDYSVAGAGTTFGDGQIQPAVDHGDQPRHQGHDGPHSPVTGANTTGGSAQSQPTDDHADQRQRSDRGGPESPGGQAVNRGGGWLRNVRGHQHAIHKSPEQGGCSQGGENKSEGSFHRISISPIIPQRMSSVLEKIDLPDQRRVILHHALTPLTNIFRGAEVREESKVVNQMRLVVIATIHRHLRPIRHSGMSHCFERLPKTPDTTKQLGRHADLPREQLNEAPLTEASISRDIANSQARVDSTKSVERESHGVMTLQWSQQMRLADGSIERLTRSAAQTATPFIHMSRCFLRQKSDFLGKQVFLGKAVTDLTSEFCAQFHPRKIFAAKGGR